jgi:hypothetical protein
MGTNSSRARGQTGRIAAIVTLVAVAYFIVAASAVADRRGATRRRWHHYAVDFAFPTDIMAPGQPPQTTVGMIHLADAFLGWLLFGPAPL